MGVSGEHKHEVTGGGMELIFSSDFFWKELTVHFIYGFSSVPYNMQ